MLRVMVIQTNVSVEKDLLGMVTSYVCLQYFRQSVHQDVDQTAIALMEFQTNVSVMVISEETLTKDAHHQQLILYRTASVELMQSVSQMVPARFASVRKALMEILSLAVLTSMSAPIIFVERMLFASTLLEIMIVDVN